MQWRSGSEIRSLFIDFWKSRGAKHYPSFSLVPEDPSLLFTIAGMVPFKQYYLGLKEPEHDSAVTSQKCVRTNDIDNVGRTARHHTFFEMLGNFSWGGYFKHGAITGAWKFLTDVIGLDPDRLYATIYEDDEEAFDIWNRVVGLPADRIYRFGREENYWYMGSMGPCGPDSEILYDQGPEFSCGKPTCAPGCDCDRYLEIWNLVFTQFDLKEDGTYAPLPRKNIDTGMGLERLTSLVQGVANDFETDLFRPIIDHVCSMAGIKYGDSPEGNMAAKVISDHIRSVAFMIADGILPANEGQGYVLRRLLRRAVRYGRLIGLDKPFLLELLPDVLRIMSDPYRELLENRLTIEQIVDVEEKRFSRTLGQGNDLLETEIGKLEARGDSVMPGGVAFELYDTYGFPLELTKEICSENSIEVDEEGFSVEMEAQRERARASSKQSVAYMKGDIYTTLLNSYGPTSFVGYERAVCETSVNEIIVDGKLVDLAEAGNDVEILLSESPFYAERGGQIGDTGVLEAEELSVLVMDTQHPAGDLIILKGKVTEGVLKKGLSVSARVDEERRMQIMRNHTATHLLHEALIRVLGGHVRQNGSLVSDELLRFDYTHFEPLTPQQIEKVEHIVNREILANVPVSISETDMENAREHGAKALFEEKYGDVVRVVDVSGFSVELCGGVHVPATGYIGSFKIIGEEGIGSGVRRITAITGINALKAFQDAYSEIRAISARLGVKSSMIMNRIDMLEEDIRKLKKEKQDFIIKSIAGQLDEAVRTHALRSGHVLYFARMDGVEADVLRQMGDKIKAKHSDAVILLAGARDKRVQIICMVGAAAEKAGAHAGKIVKEVAGIVGGGGGGKPSMAQAGGRDVSKLPEALKALPSIVEKLIG